MRKNIFDIIFVLKKKLKNSVKDYCFRMENENQQ